MCGKVLNGSLAIQREGHFSWDLGARPWWGGRRRLDAEDLRFPLFGSKDVMALNMHLMRASVP